MDELFPVVGGATGTDWTMNMCHSTDRGQTWGNRSLRTVTNAKNPTLAVNANGLVELTFQQLVGAGPAARWVTRLETTAAWPTAPTSFVLHTANAKAPRRQGLPYLGDYIRLLAVRRRLLRGLLGLERAGVGQLPQRRHLPGQRRLRHPDAARHRQHLAGRHLDRSLLRPLHAPRVVSTDSRP